MGELVLAPHEQEVGQVLRRGLRLKHVVEVPVVPMRVDVLPHRGQLREYFDMLWEKATPLRIR
jgi:hypothetical protein